MELKTKQQIEKQVEDYLDKASQHLFVIKGNYLYKVLKLYNEDKLYYATITIGKDNISINVQPAVTDDQYKWYGNATANVLKRNLFPEYYKTKSIPYFKKMRILVWELLSKIKFDNKANLELIQKMKPKIEELDLIK